MVLDGAEDMVNIDFEWCELLFFSVGLCLVLRGLLVEGTGSMILALLRCSEWWRRLLPLTSLLRGVVGCTLGRTLI